jgi:hypothetical protein
MKCHKCGGVLEKDGKFYECFCDVVRRRAAAMPPFVRRADVLPQHLKLPLMGMVKKSLFVCSSWTDMKAVVKAIMLKHLNLFLKITSDAEIRNVYVGSAAKSAKSADFDGEFYNNLQDLMDPPALMVVRLNEISNRNKAAAGALEEALCHRLDRDKPTWILSDLDKPFQSGSHAYSDTIAELVRSGYERVVVPRIAPKVVLDGGPFGEPPTPSVQSAAPTDGPGGLFSPEPVERQEPAPRRSKPQRTSRQAPEDTGVPPELEMYGQGIAKKKGSFRRGD